MIIQGGLLYQILFNQEILVWNRLENKNQMEDSTMDKKKKKNTNHYPNLWQANIKPILRTE